MREKLRLWNQYGYQLDVFDKYREAVKRSNRGSVRVFSVLAIVTAAAVMVFGFVTNQDRAGAVYTVLLLLAGLLGFFISSRQGSRRGAILAAGYLLSVATYLLSIYGTIAFRSDAFWIGTQLAVGCYLYDYAWRAGLLQVCGYAALRLAWNAMGVHPDPARLLFSTIYLIIGLVTLYMLNWARTSLIMGREESRVAADTDLLTGLTVRVAAQEEIEEHLRTDEHGVLMLLDLDRFKSVNDRLGHQIGDKVLVDVAADLKKMFRNSDVLSRLGGDEFVVYMKSVPEETWAVQRAAQVVREARRWVGNGTTNIQVTASVGIVMTNAVNRNYDDLYRAADIAMYKAKAEGGNKALLYTPDMADERETVEGPVRIDANNPDKRTEGRL